MAVEHTTGTTTALVRPPRRRSSYTRYCRTYHRVRLNHSLTDVHRCNMAGSPCSQIFCLWQQLLYRSLDKESQVQISFSLTLRKIRRKQRNMVKLKACTNSVHSSSPCKASGTVRTVFTLATVSKRLDGLCCFSQITMRREKMQLKYLFIT